MVTTSLKAKQPPVLITLHFKNGLEIKLSRCMQLNTYLAEFPILVLLALAIFSTTSNITLPSVPSQAAQSNIIGYSDLETTVKQLPG